MPVPENRYGRKRPIADLARLRSYVVMSKLFYGSYVICASLALLQLIIYGLAYLREEMIIYNNTLNLICGLSSFILLASALFSLRIRVIATLIFAVSTVWQVSIHPIDLRGMSFSDVLINGLLLLIFIIVPIVGFVSGASLLRQHVGHNE